MIKLAITAAVIVAGATAFVVGVPGLLTVDDLATCEAPNRLDNKCQKADAIIAISGGDTKARTDEAVKLFKAGWAPKLILSGAALDPYSPSNAATMREQAIDSGVPAKAILIDEFSKDTQQNASHTKPLVDGQERRVILVTSPYHQRRAGLEFQRNFGAEITVLNHPAARDKFWPRDWYKNPTSWWLAVSEMIKTLIVIAK